MTVTGTPLTGHPVAGVLFYVNELLFFKITNINVIIYDNIK